MELLLPLADIGSRKFEEVCRDLVTLVFPELVVRASMKRTSGAKLDAARRFYAGRAFVRVTDRPPQTKWATGSNLAFVSYAADPERDIVIAMGVVDNL